MMTLCHTLYITLCDIIIKIHVLLTYTQKILIQSVDAIIILSCFYFLSLQI